MSGYESIFHHMGGRVDMEIIICHSSPSMTKIVLLYWGGADGTTHTSFPMEVYYKGSYDHVQVGRVPVVRSVVASVVMPPLVHAFVLRRAQQSR
eukprot:scaffold65779_cov19-Tisochrysis_lutea.AAC.2